MLGLGLALTNFGSKGGVSDAADGGFGAADIIALSPKLWLDSSYSASMWQDTSKTVPAGIGDPVKVWQSRVGSLEASTGTDANRPIRAAGGLTYDGTGDALTTGTTTFTDTGITVYAVVSLSSVGSFPMVVSHGTTLTGQWRMSAVNNTGRMSFVNQSNNVGAGSSATSGLVAAGTTTNIAGAGATLLTGTLSTADLWTLYQDGTSRDSRTEAFTPTASAVALYIGHRNGSLYWVGDIADLLIFNTEHDTTTRESIEGYLTTKWSL